MIKIEHNSKGLASHGVSACAGCGMELCIRYVLDAVGEDTILIIPPGCSALFSGTGKETAVKVAGFQGLLENTAATASGMKAALRAKGNDHTTVLGFAGDGGTVDIGLQALSGAMERNEDIVYVCYDNEAYMNTGIQRSSSTPRFANATTSPEGFCSAGKEQNKKDLTEIMAAHNIPYVAQTTFTGNFKDFHTKANRAIYTKGPSFVNVMAPCPRGWQYPAEELAHICRMAVDTCVWPLYEIIEGEYVLNYEPSKKLPVEEFMRLQGRFGHCFKPQNEWTIEEAQSYVDEKWEKLLKKCGR